MKKSAAWMGILLLSSASAEAPGPRQSASVARTLAVSAAKLAREKSPGPRMTALAEGVVGLADLSLREAEMERPDFAGYYGFQLLRLAEEIATQVLALTDATPETDADLATAVDSAAKSADRLRAVLTKLVEKDRAALSLAIARVERQLKSAMDSIEKRGSKRGGADEKPGEKKPGEKKPGEKKPDGGEPGRPGDY